MPDVLFDQMKKLYPGMSDDEVVNQIQMADAMPTPPNDNSYVAPMSDATPANMPSTQITGPETPITAAGPSDPYKDMAIENIRKKYLGDKYSDANRQKLIDENKSTDTGNAIGAAIAGFGAGIAGGNAAQTTSQMIKDFETSKAHKLDEFDQGRSAQISDLKTGEDLTKFGQDQEKMKREMDPNSVESKLAQDLFIQMGGKPEQAAGLTAAKFKDFSPIMEKKYAAAEAANARRDVAHENALNRGDLRADRQAAHDRDSQDRAMKDTVGTLETARGNPAAAQAERDLYSADKANSLANMYGDPNKLSQRQVNLLVSEIGKIAQGGVPQMSELEGLSPDTLRGKLSRFWEKLSNSPSAANAADFVKQYTDYTNALSKDAERVVNDKYGRVLESNRKRLGEENYNTLKEQYLNRFKNSAARRATEGGPGAQGSMNPAQSPTIMHKGSQYRKVPGGWEEVQ